MEGYARQVFHGTSCAYQTTENKGGAEVRVLVGKFGFIQKFETLNDPLLERILSFCENGNFLNVDKTIRDDQFFK